MKVLADNPCRFRCPPAERLNRRFEHRLWFQVLPRDVIPSRVSQMADELSLGSAVAFPEGMQCVQFAQVMSCSFAEHRTIQPGEVMLRRQFFENDIRSTVNMGMMGNR